MPAIGHAKDRGSGSMFNDESAACFSFSYIMYVVIVQSLDNWLGHGKTRAIGREE